MDKILRDPLNEISSALRSHANIYFAVFYKMKFGFFLNWDLWCSWVPEMIVPLSKISVVHTQKVVRLPHFTNQDPRCSLWNDYHCVSVFGT